MNAFLYRRGNRYEIPFNGTHAVAYGKLGYSSLDEALQDGCVRLRDFGDKVCIQARSKALCRKYLRLYLQNRKLPNSVEAEWPGRCVLTGKELIEDLSI